MQSSNTNAKFNDLLCSIFCAWVISSCGTTVEVGSNEEEGKKPKQVPGLSADAEFAEEDEIPIISQPGGGGGIPNLGGPAGDTGPGIPNLGGPSDVDGGGLTMGGGSGNSGGGGNRDDDGLGTNTNDSGGKGSDTDGNSSSNGSGSGGTSDSSSNGGGSDDSSGGGGSGESYPLTCFGPNPSIPYDFQTFCDDIPADLKSEFATAHDVVCQDQRLINLALYDVCSWHGDQADIKKRRKVFAASDATDTSIDWFYLLTAYSLTSHSTPAEHLNLIRKEMRDPNFAKTYFQIQNSTVTNQVEHSANNFTYHVKLANSAATVSFTANLKFWKISDVLTVIFDYAVADKVIIQDHKYIRFLIDLGGGQSRIVALDEKRLNDSGQHNVAYSNLINIVHQRMEKDYENSLRD